MAKANAGGCQKLAFSGAISDFYWTIVIMLLPRAANRPDLESRANRQAERGLCHSAWMAVCQRTVDLASSNLRFIDCSRLARHYYFLDVAQTRRLGDLQ